jgi:hypothetical protein
LQARLQAPISGLESLRDLERGAELGLGAAEISARESVLTGTGVRAPAPLSADRTHDQHNEDKSSCGSEPHAKPPGAG